jgi:hypothetical protein
MRAFISCDIEGITTTTIWDESCTQTKEYLPLTLGREGGWVLLIRKEGPHHASPLALVT